MNRKMIFFLAIILAISCVLPFHGIEVVYAEGEEEDKPTLEEQLEDAVDSQLSGLDLSGAEEVLSRLGKDEISFFGANSFMSKLSSVLNGEFREGQTSVFNAVVNLIFDDLLEYLPVVATMIAIAIICGFIAHMRSAQSGKSVGDIIYFVCYGVIITIILGSVVSVVNMTGSTLSLLKSQMDVVFPILLTVLTAMGGAVSVGVYQPAMALLSGGVMQLFISLLMPIFLFTFVFTIVSNISTNVKLDKFTNFFSYSFKWIIGGIFTIFLAFLSIQGITAGAYDGVSIRTAKYAIRSYVPILGGYLSEGFDLIMASSVLIKNAVGATGLLLLFATIIVPIVKIVILILCLKLAASVLEPISDSRISNFIYSSSKALSMLIIMIIGVAFMYLISTGLIMCTSNFL